MRTTHGTYTSSRVSAGVTDSFCRSCPNLGTTLWDRGLRQQCSRVTRASGHLTEETAKCSPHELPAFRYGLPASSLSERRSETEEGATHIHSTRPEKARRRIRTSVSGCLTTRDGTTQARSAASLPTNAQQKGCVLVMCEQKRKRLRAHVCANSSGPLIRNSLIGNRASDFQKIRKST